MNALYVSWWLHEIPMRGAFTPLLDILTPETPSRQATVVREPQAVDVVRHRAKGGHVRLGGPLLLLQRNIV